MGHKLRIGFVQQALYKMNLSFDIKPEHPLAGALFFNHPEIRIGLLKFRICFSAIKPLFAS
ncbi:hypothetical protein HMPREF3213_02404 [Heyndrickxia coagulans]|uniref:Uncharacterized protein n=1 Tax=Heyndrickxia coagulans TaxID=1398 RepID=A0A133KKA4_HEYCO|nr:hypothetical protein HMPREF3213_02404 [Heyndrickxia coagulans]